MAKYFSAKETEGLNQRLVVLLDQMRGLAGIPVTITCGFRSPDKNVAIGGVADSAHESGLAADIRCADSVSRFSYVEAALSVGFKRIEIADKHIHVDIDESKPQRVIWIGTSH